MIHLLYEALPEVIHADGREIPILTDFRAWLQFIGMVSDKELPEWEKIRMMREWLCVDAPVTREVVEGLLTFCRAAELEPDQEAKTDAQDVSRKPPTFDWAVDAKFVLADFRRYYGMDLLRTGYLHWWEFRALFSALPSESTVMQRVGIRDADLSKIPDKHRRAKLAEIQRRIALPFEMDEDGIADVFAEMM